jgi:hypothetical protein
MGALRDPQELRDVPAVAVCAQCGDPECPGHDFERSGERPIHRLLAWEDGETPPLRSLWRTAMATASDLELWVRASRSTGNGIGPALTFALACEVAAVVSTTVPLALVVGGAAWWLFRDASILGAIAATFGRIALVFVPMMIVIHLVHQTIIAKVGAQRGSGIPRAATVRAGLYACGWDLATGPAGVLAPLLRLDVAGARARMAGNSTLYRDATRIWLRDVHGVEEPADIKAAQRATLPWMIALLVAVCAGVGWAILTALV